MDIEAVKIGALLHDIGKPLGRLKIKKHPEAGAEFVKKFLPPIGIGDIEINIIRNHHDPITEEEKIVTIADWIDAGIEREHEESEEKERLDFLLNPITSEKKDNFHVNELLRNKFGVHTGKDQFENLLKEFRKIAKHGDFISLYSALENGKNIVSNYFRMIPASTYTNQNDHSLWIHLKMTCAFATCLAIDYNNEVIRELLIPRNVTNPIELQNYHFYLISGDVDRIQKFIMESRRLPDLTASSKMIEDAIEEVKKRISEILGHQCIIYYGGGGITVVSPISMKDEIENTIKEVFEKEMQNAVAITVTSKRFNGQELINFGKCWDELMKDMRKKKARKDIEISEERIAERCTNCRIREALIEDGLKKKGIRIYDRTINEGGGPERLCSVCLRKREYGTELLKSESLGIKGLEDIEDKNGFVAILKLDLDDAGKWLKWDKDWSKIKEKPRKSAAPATISTVSETLEYLINRLKDKILEKHKIGYEYKCRVIYAGGDDLLAIIPAKGGLELVQELNHIVDKETNENIKFSVGLVIMKTRYPIYLALNDVKSALEEAKESGKDSIKIVIIKTGAKIVTIRPYKFRDFDKLIKLTKRISKFGFSTLFHRLAVVYSQIKDIDEVDSLIKYTIGKESENEEKVQFLSESLDSIKNGQLFDMYNTMQFLEVNKNERTS